jgi:hypothetical protein
MIMNKINYRMKKINIKWDNLEISKISIHLTIRKTVKKNLFYEYVVFKSYIVDLKGISNKYFRLYAINKHLEI